MILKGFYRFEKDGEIHNCRNVRFENTDAKWDNGKVIWRKISKDGKRTNIFAEQFNPDMPWCHGKWFCKIGTEYVLRDHPELKIEV